MDLSNSFAWVVSIHLFILNRITEGGLFGYSIELTNILHDGCVKSVKYKKNFCVDLASQ